MPESTPDSMACREFVELVTAWLDDVLPPDVRTAFDIHVDACDGCRLYLGQMRLTIHALRHRRAAAAPTAATDRLRTLYRTWLARGV